MHEPPSPVKEGDIIADKYRVERVLGAGGMGVVVLASDVQLERQVAIKFLLEEHVKQVEAAERFLREARAAVKIQSEHVARVIDVGTLRNGAPYMVMEYLIGNDLSQAIEQRGPCGVEEAVGYVLEACEAIAEAHAHGIVHRDLKPANLFLSRKAGGHFSIKVLDFGISKHTAPGSSSNQSLTRTSSMMGSPLYMSPEQMRSSRDVDARTDIWALSVILYELLMGHPPFVADSMPALCAMILTDPPVPLRTKRSDVPPGLETAIFRALEKDPARRFDNVGDFAQALLPYGPKSGRASVERISRVLQEAGFRTSQVDIPPSLAPGGRPSAAQTAVDFGSTQSEAKKRSPVPVLVGVGLFLVAAVGLGAFALMRGSPAESGAAAAPAMEATAEPVVKTVEAPPAPVVAPVEAPRASAAPAPEAVPAPSSAPTVAVAAAAAARAATGTKARPAAKAPAAPAPKVEAPPAPAPTPAPAAAKPAATGIKNKFGTRK